MESCINVTKSQIIMNMTLGQLIDGCMNSPEYECVYYDAENDFKPRFRITDKYQFAIAIIQELTNNPGDGNSSSLIEKAFDKAAYLAIENGCEGVEFDND